MTPHRPLVSRRTALVGMGAAAGTLAAAIGLDPAAAPAGALAAVCLALWLAEAVPPFVPTLVLLAGAPLVTGLRTAEVLEWVADPVLLLFFGGFVLGEAAAAHGLDRRVVQASIDAARGRAVALIGIVLAATAFLSMWISNVAAAALILAALKPVLDRRLARPLLVAVAMGANLGGMATPIGTGPNAIAISAMAESPTFLGWMVLALPITVGALVVAFGWIVRAHGVGGPVDLRVPRARPEGSAGAAAATTPPGVGGAGSSSGAAAEPSPATGHGERPRAVALVGALAVALWLTEPVHQVPAAVVSAGCAAVLFGSGLLPPARLRQLDWSTLVLVAGGIGLGGLLDHVGVVDSLAAAIVGADAPRVVVLAGLLLTTATLSALMSNTATATLLVPIAAALLPEVPGAPILVALAASFGMPFVVSTPPNAMVVGAGLSPSDLLRPGLLLMVGGCLVLALTGPWVLTLGG